MMLTYYMAWSIPNNPEREHLTATATAQKSVPAECGSHLVYSLHQTWTPRYDKVVNQMERDFDLLGITAVEDKIQIGVPETVGRSIFCCKEHVIFLVNHGKPK